MGKRGAGRKRRGGIGRGVGRKRDGGSNRRRSGGRGHGGRGDEFFAGLPLGPETVRELSDWGPHVIRGLQRGKDGEDDGSALYLAGTWQRMTWRTDYSGFDCPRWAMEIGLAALQSEYGIAGSCVWEFVRSCDIGSLQTKFLTHIARQETPSPCHFGAIQKRLHAQAQRFISAAMPDDNDGPAEKQRAYNQIREWLLANRSWAYPEKSVCECLVHEKECPTYPTSLSVHEATLSEH